MQPQLKHNLNLTYIYNKIPLSLPNDGGENVFMASRLLSALKKSWKAILFIILVDIIEWLTTLQMLPLDTLVLTITADVTINLVDTFYKSQKRQ